MITGENGSDNPTTCTDPLYCENGQPRSPEEITILKSSVIVIFLVRPGDPYPYEGGVGTVVGNGSTVVTAAHVPGGRDVPIYGFSTIDANGNQTNYDLGEFTTNFDGSKDLLTISLNSDIPGVVPATPAPGYDFQAGDSAKVAYNPSGFQLGVLNATVNSVPRTPGLVLGKLSIFGVLNNPPALSGGILGHGDSGGGVFIGGSFVGVISNIPFSYALFSPY